MKDVQWDLAFEEQDVAEKRHCQRRRHCMRDGWCVQNDVRDPQVGSSWTGGLRLLLAGRWFCTLSRLRIAGRS